MTIEKGSCNKFMSIISRAFYLKLNTILLIIAVTMATSVQAQSILGGTNSGASSNGINPYSIGEIFVIGTDPNTNSSGILGAYSTILLKTSNGLLSVFNEEVKAFPNPTQKEITIQIKNGEINDEIEIFDLSGKLILIQKPINNQINLTDIPNGNYLLKISKTKSIQISKK